MLEVVELMEAVAPMEVRQGMEGQNTTKMMIMITTTMTRLSIEVEGEVVMALAVAVVRQTTEARIAATTLRVEAQDTKRVPILIKITETWKRPASVLAVLLHRRHHPLLQAGLQVQAPLDQVHQQVDDGFGQKVLENGNGRRLALLHLEMLQVQHCLRPTKEIPITT